MSLFYSTIATFVPAKSVLLSLPGCLNVGNLSYDSAFGSLIALECSGLTSDKALVDLKVVFCFKILTGLDDV